jgi:hypothetical protein
MTKHRKHQKKHNKDKHCETQIPLTPRTVDISKLKAFVDNNFPQESPLRIVFVGEDDPLSAEAFLAKLPIWLKLLKTSTRN